MVAREATYPSTAGEPPSRDRCKSDVHGIVKGIQNRVDKLIAVAELQLKSRRELLRRLKFFGCQK